VGAELWVDYQRAAETLADQVVADPRLYGLVVTQDGRAPGPGDDVLTVEAEDPAAVKTTGGSDGDSWNLWSAGDLTASFDLPAAGTWTVSASVWADQAGPDLASARLAVDGQELLVTDVTATNRGSAESLEDTVQLSAGTHTVTVSFLNDYYLNGEDRNLHVDFVRAEGSGGGGTPPGDAGRDEWIAAFGERAFRRPLDATETTEYATLFAAAAEIGATGDPFRDGVQLVLAAMLQAPQFLYRTEESATPDGSGRIPLSDWELASKLSYALWNTMPDEELFTVAREGRLRDMDELSAQTQRLLVDPRARATIADLHRQLLHVDNYQNITKATDLYPEFRPSTPASMQAEAYAFVEDVVFSDGSVHELFTRPSSFVNEDLAPIYGISGVTGSELVPRDLDPAQRAGLLTLSGFLALEADSYVHSPIRRGVFMNLAVLCTDLPPPPDNVPPVPPATGVQTTRERVDAHTGPGTCGSSCHATLINPLGFGFEHYDALGRWQDEELGLPVDSQSEFSFTDGERSFADAVELSALIGSSFDAHRCYTKHLVEYLEGRPAASEDDAVLNTLARRSVDEDRPILALVTDLILTDGFRFRTATGGE
jgi:hypothetical protein